MTMMVNNDFIRDKLARDRGYNKSLKSQIHVDTFRRTQ